MQWHEVLTKLKPAIGVPNIHRILLAGPKGTTKSSWASRNLSSETERVALNPDSGPEDVLGTWALRDNSTIFVDGPAIRAMRKGCPLVIDEIDRGGSAVTTVLHAILDDPEIAAITLPTGEVIRPVKGFCVFGTMNGNPEDLPDALLDRFDLVLRATIPVPEALDSLPQQEAKALKSYYSQLQKNLPAWRADMSFRRFLARQKIARVVGEDLSYQLVFGAGAAEVQSVVATQTAKV